jgi:YbgC/YbaW family acyl-CoA thioester hydrolase
MHEFRTRRKIEFSDTDLGGVVHFSRYFIYMETAEDEMLRTLGGSFWMEHQGRTLGWPKVEVSCTYARSARYGDDLEIRLKVLRKGTRSITYEFDFRRGDESLATGRTTSVCCASGPDGTFEAIPIPEEIASQLEEAPR